MNFLKDLFSSDRIKIAKENEKMRLSKKNLEKELEQEILKTNEIKDKYIAILEEKCDGFDKYVYYEQKCIEDAEKIKEIKKEKALLEEKVNALEEDISQRDKTIAKLEKKITKTSEKKQ